MRTTARSVGLVVLTLLVTLSVQRVVAMTSDSGNASLGAKNIRVVTGGPAQTSGGTGAFVHIPGATLHMTIPSGQHGLVVARFTASDWCSGGTHDVCRLGMRLHGPGLPADGANLVGSEDWFDSNDVSGQTPEGHSEEGFVGGLGPGTYTLVASFLTDPPTIFHLRTWIMTAEYWRRA